MVNNMKMKFEKMGINGEGIGYDNRFPVFCDGVLPHETAEIEITTERDTFAKAKAVKILKKSSDRVESPCPYQDICGGCPLMIMNYKSQLYNKKLLLEEALYKYAHVRRNLIREMHGSELVTGYRSQCKLPVEMSNNLLTAGMYTSYTNHFKPIKECLVHTPLLEKAKRQVIFLLNEENYKAYDSKTRKGLRYLVMRELQGFIQCTLVTGNETIPDTIIEKLMEIRGMHSLFQSINTEKDGFNIFGSSTKKLAGANTTPVTINGIKLRLSPQSFFQLNIPQAEKLYEMAVSKIDPCDVLVEAYCGVGAMSLLAKDKAKEIYGIENVRDAIRNCEENAKINHIENASFILDDAAKGLLKIGMRKQVDTLLLDPPRSGMDENMIEAVKRVLPKKIIYVSCNPATLGKNIRALKKEYNVATIIPFDLFPNTAQVESVTVLERYAK